MKYHFIGIKGAGMSSLACLLSDYGHLVQGSDVVEDFFTVKNLLSRNISIFPFNEKNIKKGYIIIVGNAFINNKEHLKAKELGCKIYTYYAFLGSLSKKFTSIAISGTHGKTTTTNLIQQIFTHYEPVNYLVGDGQGGGNKESQYFVFEACEYQRHFLYYFPKMAVITNIDYDHPDYYKDIHDLQDAFKQFMKQSQIIVYNGDDLILRESIPTNMTCISFGISDDNDYSAMNIHNDSQFTYYDFYIKKAYIGKIKIPLFGNHSVYNSLAAIAASYFYISDFQLIQHALEKFKVGKRRFEEHVVDSQIIISDYAHHPKEIYSTIDAVKKKYPDKQIIIYFQPHTYTRTITFLNSFADVLKLADYVYLREIFSSAREKDKIITIDDLAKCIPNSKVINNNEYLKEFQNYKNCVIIFMGAGDSDKFCEQYLNFVKNDNNFEKSS